MAITRITQSMLSHHSLDGLQSSLAKSALIQEQMSSGKILNRPSDNPSGTSQALRMRADLSATQQYSRNAQDGIGWLSLTDTTIGDMTDEARTARDIGLQGANSGTTTPASREALAKTVEQIRDSMISEANTKYLGRPVFGGITSGDQAYDSTGTYVGQAGTVERTVGEGVKVRVDTDGSEVFGAAGDDVFAHLTDLAAKLRTGTGSDIATATGKVSADLDRLAAAHAEVGTRYARLEAAQTTSSNNELSLKKSLSSIEDVDLTKATVDLQMQQVAYQAALGATSRVLQPTLAEFLK